LKFELADLMTTVAAMACLLGATICLAGEPAGAAEPAQPEATADVCDDDHTAANPHGGMDPHAAAADPHADLLDDPDVARVASQMTCPAYCEGTVLQKCSERHRHMYGGIIARFLKIGTPDNMIIAHFAEKYGVHVLQHLAIAAHAGGEQAKGEITGKVINISDDKRPVPNADVGVFAYAGAIDPVKIMTVKSDEEGSFQITDLPIRKVSAFELRVSHAGQEHSSGRAILTTERIKAKITLSVYDTTDDTSAIVVSLHHITVELGEGILRMTEMLRAENTGTRTIVSNDDELPIFRVSVPDGVTNVILSGDFEETNSAVVDGWAVYNGTFEPGQKQFVLRHDLLFDKPSFDFVRVLGYDTSSITFMFPDFAGTRAESNDFAKQKRMNMGKRSYYSFSEGERKAGSALTLKLTVPVPPPNVFKWPALWIAGFFAAVFLIRMATGKTKVRE